MNVSLKTFSQNQKLAQFMNAKKLEILLTPALNNLTFPHESPFIPVLFRAEFSINCLDLLQHEPTFGTGWTVIITTPPITNSTPLHDLPPTINLIPGPCALPANCTSFVHVEPRRKLPNCKIQLEASDAVAAIGWSTVTVTTSTAVHAMPTVVFSGGS